MSSSSDSGSSDSDSSSSGGSDGPTRRVRPQVASSLAPLRYLPTQRVIDEPSWRQDSNDAQHRLNVSRYSMPARSSVSSGASVQSTTSSMAMTSSSRSVQYASTRTPSLTGSRSTLPSHPSSRASYSGSMYPPQNLFDIGEGGVLERPIASPPARWQCSFGFLGCRVVFEDMSSWDTHCRYHFRGQLPKTIECPFQCQWYHTANSGEEAWRHGRAHIMDRHPDGGQMRGRASRSLVEHLWRKKVISDAEEQELRAYGSLRNTSVYLQSNKSQGRRREQRSVESCSSRRGIVDPYER